MTQSNGGAGAIKGQLEALRKKLLDLSLRNRMLNYRPSKRLGITVTDEDSFQLHRLLVDESKRMSFVGKPDPPRQRVISDELATFSDEVSQAQFREAAEDELSAYIESPAMPVDQMDSKLQTDDFESVLQAKLRAIQREQHLANEELGVNTLFLTLGALEWRETEQRSFVAPLLFMPIALERMANGSMRLTHDGSDVGENLPLRAKLAEFNLKVPTLDDDKSLLDYFEEFEATIRHREDWNIRRDDVCLGFFNYEKYAMYVDLGGDNWDAESKPWQSQELVKLLGGGFEPAENSPNDHTFLDEERPADSCHEVWDADSSQTIALIRAAKGLSIIVEGPPGTGKSQTITNIIAEAVARGQTVLFVAAKRPAVEVVLRRLRQADLGDMCLDMHDKLTNRKQFYEEIKRTANRVIVVRAEDERIARLGEVQRSLNQYCRAVNDQLEQYGVTPFEAMTILARLPKETAEDVEGRIPFDSISMRSHREIQMITPMVRALQARLKKTGVPQHHPFWGATIDYLDPATRLDIEEALKVCDRAFTAAQQAITNAATFLGIPTPTSIRDIGVMHACARRAIEAPFHDGVSVHLATWEEQEESIRGTIAHLQRYIDVHARHDAAVLPQIWRVDLSEELKTFDELASRWYRFLSLRFRRARRSVKRFVLAKHSDLELKALLTAQSNGGQSEEHVLRNSEGMARMFGVQWRALETKPEAVEGLLDWVLSLHKEVHAGTLPAGLLSFLSGSASDEQILTLTQQAEQLSKELADSWNALARLLQFNKVDALAEPIESLGAFVRTWRDSLTCLPDLIALNEVRRQLGNSEMASVVSVADTWPGASEKLSDSVIRSYYTGAVRHATLSRPELKNFERAAHEASIEEFCELDDFKLRYNRARVRLAHQRSLPTFENAVGNLQLLRLQCELQRKHKSIRWAMSRAGAAIQKIKPVFMMSPLSVAIHLPPELPAFDIVIFDEASQVKPEDALCSIIRAKQTIVVGDTRQMPPTTFFDRVADDEDYDDEVDGVAELGQEARKLESILSLMSAVTLGQARRPDLRWHYRSIHPALIQPSNEMFYDNRLIVFPSPSVEQDGRRIGIVFHHHPETVYEPGATKRINRREAEIVAQAVLQHVIASPTESLMVAAMNKQQSDLIYDEVLKLERSNPQAFASFADRHRHEPLAIKNLENVQGDERDVVFISITYGRDASGVIMQRFGPILKDGGERRLNVLISRSRRRCEVFSNIVADDLRLDNPRPGLLTLKRYLSFAQYGRMEVAVPTGEVEESPFEEEVSSVLRNMGYMIDTQVGSEGYRIDMAVLDSESPGRYLLGVECDGATYHSARSARDRDKLRQRVLEDRGWKLHRIWSYDWWQDRDGEIKRLIKAIESAKVETSQSTDIEDEPDVPHVVEVTQPRSASLRAYEATPTPSQIDTEGQLAQYLIQVVQVEGPIHLDMLLARLRDAAGYGKTGRQLRAWFEALVKRAVSAGQIRMAADAYYYSEDQLQLPRNWAGRPTGEKNVDLITQPEIAAAMRQLARSAYGVLASDLTKESIRLLGLSATSKAVSRGASVLNEMLESGALVDRDGLLFLS